MTRPDIEAIAARAAAATEGPWDDLWFGPDTLVGYRADAALEWPNYSDKQSPLWRRGGQVLGEDDHTLYLGPGAAFTPLDATFIAHARTDVPALVAYVEELEAELLRFEEPPETREEKTAKVRDLLSDAIESYDAEEFRAYDMADRIMRRPARIAHYRGYQ